MSTNSPADTLLSVRGLTASVDEKTILHGVDLDVAAGETHVIMGPNGAGKSTMGHVIMGDPVYTVTQGSVHFDGQDITDLSCDKRSRAGLFLSFQAPVEIPGVPLSSFLRATLAGREGLEMKGKQFRRRVTELARELNMDTAYLNRELGVGFSGGEKKKIEMLQLLLLQPKLAILDETDSGLDVDALGVVSRGMDAYRKSTDGSLVIITHNRVHVMVNGRIVREDDASLIPWIDANGFDTFEREAAATLAAEHEAADDSANASAAAAMDAVRAAAGNLGAGMVQSLRATLDANGTADAADNTAAANTAAAADAAAGETR